MQDGSPCHFRNEGPFNMHPDVKGFAKTDAQNKLCRESAKYFPRSWGNCKNNSGMVVLFIKSPLYSVPATTISGIQEKMVPLTGLYTVCRRKLFFFTAGLGRVYLYAWLYLEQVFFNVRDWYMFKVWIRLLNIKPTLRRFLSSDVYFFMSPVLHVPWRRLPTWFPLIRQILYCNRLLKINLHQPGQGLIFRMLLIADWLKKIKDNIPVNWDDGMHYGCGYT